MFKWISQDDSDMYRSLKGIVNNDGFFKSAGQAAFFERVCKSAPHIGPTTCWDDSVTVAEGQCAITCDGIVGLSEDPQRSWGGRTRRKTWIFVIDAMGVVAMHIGRCRHIDGQANPNGEKTTCEFTRTDSKRARQLASAWAEERAAKAKILGDKRAASEHVGNVGDRIVVEGVARFITSFDTQYGTSYLYVIDGKDGNAYKFIGTSIHPHTIGSGATFSIKAKFTVKKHDEYNGQNQTIVNRPKVEAAEAIA